MSSEEKIDDCERVCKVVKESAACIIEAMGMLAFNLRRVDGNTFYQQDSFDDLAYKVRDM